MNRMEVGITNLAEHDDRRETSTVRDRRAVFSVRRALDFNVLIFDLITRQSIGRAGFAGQLIGFGE